MPPASRPALSWRGAQRRRDVVAVLGVKFSGSAPYFSELARWVAWVWVKLPLTWVLPLIVPWMSVGLEMTSSSRVKAT